ncbi:MAG: bifunctional riboflavin kinase/FAD synthetase [candidate division Zixibacteria bacterium]|nr:bifunctional riboflavin kinase/FAD synthetase [candidate division Zixibacteria bacterium]
MSLEIIYGIENLMDSGERSVVTIGTFDGIHLGHQAILKRLMTCAQDRGVTPMAVTFEPHPRVLVTPDSPPPLLTIWEEKVRLFAPYMAGRLLVLRFTPELMNNTAEQFTESILVDKLNVQKLIVGYDHAFGKNRTGTINDLMELSRRFSFELEVVNPVIIEGKPVSSTRIRRLIANRQFSQALDMLGHPYPIHGIVQRGIALGKKVGYPTANVKYNDRKLLPADGVYSCSVDHGDGHYDGMMFIGQNHFNPEGGRTVEVNIFDFNGDLYDREIVVYPEVFIRENNVFPNTDALVVQLARDRDNVVRIKHKGETK